MSSFGATGLFEYERDPPVFRIVVMGSPETGKTALCNRLVAHSFSDHTQHTRSIDSYFVTLSDLVVGDAAAGGTGAPRRIPTVCELQDVPGEAHEGVLPGTPEYRVTLKAARHCPRPSNAKQWRDSEYTPSAQELLVNARAAELEQEEKAHSFSNVLYNMRPPMGFIVLVSFNPKVATASFGKAKHIINTLKRNRFLTETPTPLLLFANMEDETMLGISGAVPSGHIAKLMNDCVALVSHADMREHARLAFGSVKGGWASFVDTSRRGGKARFVTAGRPDAELPPQGSLREAWAAALPTPLYPSAVRLGKTETGAEFTTPCRFPLDFVLRWLCGRLHHDGKATVRMIYDRMYSDMHEPNQHRHGKVTSDTRDGKKTKSGDGGDGGRHTSYDDDAANKAECGAGACVCQ